RQSHDRERLSIDRQRCYVAPGGSKSRALIPAGGQRCENPSAQVQTRREQLDAPADHDVEGDDLIRVRRPAGSTCSLSIWGGSTHPTTLIPPAASGWRPADPSGTWRR